MPDQGPSKFEALKQGAKELFNGAANYVEGKTAVGLIALTALAGVGVVAANQLNTEPANAAPIPEATASDLQQDCTNAVPKVKIVGAIMSYPGDRRKQSIGTEARVSPVSDICRSVVTLDPTKVFFKVENPQTPGKYAKSKPQVLKDDNGMPIGDEGGSGVAYLEGFGGRKGLDYRCSKKGTTDVKAVYKFKIDSVVDGSTLKIKTKTIPVKIRPVPPSLVQGGGVARTC